jgi:glycosyltransferase involved in cell wall biosynthesis
VGRLTEEKGIISLLESWKGLPYTLRIFGSGPFQDMAKNYAFRYPNITFHGQAAKDGIVAEMRKCSILLFSSVWFEPFGMTIIEAFACGMPVMAFEIGGISSLIKDGVNGILIKDKSIEGLRNAIDRWAKLDPSLKKNYQQNARQTFLRFYTNDTNLQSLLHIYKSVPGI